MSDAAKHHDSDHDTTTGLPDELPGGPDEQPGNDRPLVESKDLDADDEG